MERTRLERRSDYWAGHFEAMASPCEILIDSESHTEAARLLEVVSKEAWRIERKYSRYRSDNVVYDINNGAGGPVEVDSETADLLDFAQECHEMSGGLFDVTSGVLRSAWKFDGSDRVPTPEDVGAVQHLVGWHRIRWRRPLLTMPSGMEVDLGGIGKEYAVDRAARMAAETATGAVVVNFGGDMHVAGPRRDGRAWAVGIERPGDGDQAVRRLEGMRGGVATSGDARRFLLKDGVRYPHVLNPRTGWPVMEAPRSVTVLADSCTEAGMLSTMAMLQGGDAESFLEAQGVRFWCIR